LVVRTVVLPAWGVNRDSRGVQIVGRDRDDLGVLQLAHAFEEATGFWETRPPVAE
jgi:Asp-tRNA(Asn)/Glu-tRNA(Gln) amidotransferase A subunit family amidase